jgi:hypothetical protein
MGRYRKVLQALPVLIALAALASCASAPAGPPPAPESVVGRWAGTVTAEELATIAIIVVFAPDLSGTMDVPAQGKAGERLTDITIAPPRVHFELPIDEGKAVFDGTLRGDTISGTFTQGPLTATFSIHRSDGS